MIDQRKINRAVADGLKELTGCEVVKSNRTGRIPSYPYISFTITSADTDKGTYSVADGVKYIPLKEVWSITVQGKDDNEVMHLALLAKDWFEEQGRLYLKDNGIIPLTTTAVSDRDNFLTIEYEYRKGFDVQLSFTNIIVEADGDDGTDVIEKVVF